jgi:leucine-rich repeat protein SHOC2
MANLHTLTGLDLSDNQLNSLPKNIAYLSSLTSLDLHNNQLNTLPDSIGEISNLIWILLDNNKLSILPESIGNLRNLSCLYLDNNQLTALPDNIGNLSDLTVLSLRNNKLNYFPETISSLTSLNDLNLDDNKLSVIPSSITNLSYLTELKLNNNPLMDLSILQSMPILNKVFFLGVYLPRRYWTKLSDWKSEWLLDEDNAEIKRILIQQLGYEKICEEVCATSLDNWRQYTLLKINSVETIYGAYGHTIGTEPMVLLKMTCPSTGHIHILRVPPEMTSAEAAITWVNHGIHPDEFAVQT